MLIKAYLYLKKLFMHLFLQFLTNTRVARMLTTFNMKQVLGVSVRVRANPSIKKIQTPEFQSIFTDELKTLTKIFSKYNYELRIAGGAVRDILMGLEPKDIDFATTATPEKMKKMFTNEDIRMINDNGEKHGTITPHINGVNFEVTTLRIDVRTDGRHAEVNYTTNWQLDANRRDLTINSMFLGLDGTVYDYFYGYDDLQARRVVFVGEAAIRIQEDYLRILRYFRFYGRIASEPTKHDPETIKAIKANGNGLKRISGERIWNELKKIVLGNFNKELMLEILDCGLGTYCGLPDKPNTKEFKRFCDGVKSFKEPHHPILFIIALLNNKNEVISLHERLKLTSFERDVALFIIQQREEVDNEYVTLFDYQKLCMAQNVRREYIEELLKYSNKFELYTQLKACELPKFPINGKILQLSGCVANVQMGLIMKELKTIWFESKFTLTKDELIEKYLPAAKEKVESLPSPAFVPNKVRKRKSST